MGGGRFSAEDWGSYSSSHVAGKTTEELYTAHKIDKNLDVKDVKFRESCDSKDNPKSNAIIVALDVTGSMHPVLDTCAKNLGVLVTEIYKRKPVEDPHLMFMGIGDVECDDSPIQATQFEADIRIAEQLQKIYFEQGGGGNSYESYSLAWYFAAKHTKIDCWEKREIKGNLFTIGDEMPTPLLSAAHIKRFLGDRAQKDYTSEELLELVSKQYNVFHLLIEQGQNFAGKKGVDAWVKILGQRCIRISDVEKIAEVIVSVLQHEAGVDKTTILKSWDKKTALVVSKAIDGMALVKGEKKGGVTKL